MAYEAPCLYHTGSITAVLDRRLHQTAEPPSPVDWRIQRILRFVEKEDGKLGWNLDNLCGLLQLGISGSHAAKLFVRHTGIGIREYAKQRRLRVAAEQLRSTTDSVKTIALGLGYRTPNDLQRQFKKLFALNPTEFRTAYRQPVLFKESAISPQTAHVKRIGGGTA